MISKNFSTYGQIIYDTDCDRPHSVEFLSRHNTQHGIDIESIFKTADTESLMRWFNRQLAEAVEFYNKTRIEPHVNIDLRTFEELTNREDWSEEVKDYDLELTIEVTQVQGIPDKELIQKMQDPANFPNKWPWKGINVALDDYDIHNIKEQNVKEYNFDIVKFDRSLITEMEYSNKVYQHIKKLIIDNPRIDFIAEGVETIHQVKMLQDVGIHLFQGFYFHRPESLENLIKRLA